MYFTSKLRFFPGVPAVGGYFHLLNDPAAGPSQAGDLVDTGTWQLLSAGGGRDDGFRSPTEIESSSLRISGDVTVIVVRHVILVHHFHAPQPLGVINPLESGNDQAHRITILGTDGLTI